jgi:hypothetical protein
MKTYVYLWKYLAEVLEREMFQNRVLQKKFFSLITFSPPKIMPFFDNVKKYGTARQATDDNTICCRRSSCRINKARM